MVREVQCERRSILKLFGVPRTRRGLQHNLWDSGLDVHSCSGLCRELKTTSVCFQMSLALLGIAGAFQFDLIWIVPGT